jgi:hypothetical protein
MSRLAISFVLVLAATAANAQDTKSGQSQTPAVASTNGTRPSYLMDECEVMAPGRARSPTIIAPTLAPSSCPRKQASRGASDETARQIRGEAERAPLAGRPLGPFGALELSRDALRSLASDCCRKLSKRMCEPF